MFPNEIYLKKKKKVITIDTDFVDNPCSKNEFATFISNIVSTGFIFAPELLDDLSKYSAFELQKLQEDIVPVLNEMAGNDKNHKVFYPNFPKQVMEASEMELFFNAVMHYFSFHLYDLTYGQTPIWFPDYKKEPRNPLDENIKLKVIEKGDWADFRSIFTELVGSNSSISEYDKKIVDWFIRNHETDIELPENIPYKENLALLVGLLHENNVRLSILRSAINTPTDVLRIATVLSGGDVSLAQNTKFRKMSRKERKWLLDILNNDKFHFEDMYRNRGRWLRLGEILHPGDYKNKYRHAFNLFNKVRNQDKIEKFNGRVDKLFKEKNLHSLLDLLSKRPGEFARRLDLLLRTFQSVDIVSSFNKVIDKVSTPVLLQIIGHFEHRNEDNDVRVFFPKGSIAKAYVKENDLAPIKNALSTRIIIVCGNELKRRFAKLEDWSEKTVYIDDRLADIKLPFGDRSASEGLITYPRGSRFDMPDKDTIRFFIHWRNIERKIGHDRVDLDLSCVLYYDGWKKAEHISYTNLRNRYIEACHSGDITDGGRDGVSEFIDINTEKLKDGGIRYVIPTILSFTHQPFIDIPDCIFGWMGRKYPQSGEIYDPLTVENKINLTANQVISVPMIIDTFKDEIIWADLGITRGKFANNVESNNGGLIDLAKAVIYDEKPSVGKLLNLHKDARDGQDVFAGPEYADITFTLENITEKFDEIKSEYML